MRCPRCGTLWRLGSDRCGSCGAEADFSALGPAGAAAAAPSSIGRGPVTPPAPPGRPPTSRWAASAVSFGPVGRIVATLLVLLVGVWLLWASLFGMVGGFLWLGIVTPWALRDIWRPVRR